MTINDFLGNSILKETFLSFFKDKKVPHSIILEGDKGVGKKTFAKIIAQNVMCKFSKPIPCETCNDCKKILSDIHPDVIYPEKSGALNTFSVATVREVRKDAYVMPNEAEYKIYIFLDANNMNASAQNALLKVIEEPPKNVIFIFTCDSSRYFLDTIKSRSQIFSVKAPPEDEALKFLYDKFSDVDVTILKNFLKLSAGNIGKTIELLENKDENDEYLLAEEILKTMLIPNECELLKVFSKIKNDRDSFKLILTFLFNFLEDAFSYSVDSNAKASKIAKCLVEQVSIKKIMLLIEFINEIINLINKNVSYNLLLSYMTSNLYSIVF